MDTDTAYQNLSFGALEDYIGVGDPVYLQWFGNTSVSISGIPNALIGSKANIKTTKPVSLTLCLSRSLGHPTVSVIDTDISGDSYTWTPNGSLSNGEYSLEIWQNNGDFAFSHDVTLVDGRTNNDASTSSEASTSVARVVVSTYSAATVSAIQITLTGSTSSSSILASEHSFSSAPVTATATLPGNTAPISATSPPSPDAQNVPVLQHTISNGDIAGVVVGVVGFILLTTASAMLCWRRRHRSSQIGVSELPSHQMDAEIKSDPSATVWIPELGREGAVCGPHELAGTSTSLGSLGANEPCLAEVRAFEIANPE